jgi:hypothetical protein
MNKQICVSTMETMKLSLLIQASAYEVRFEVLQTGLRLSPAVEHLKGEIKVADYRSSEVFPTFSDKSLEELILLHRTSSSL